MLKFSVKIIAIFSLLSIFFPNLAVAQNTGTAVVDYNNLLSDEELADYNTMTLADISNFLLSKNSYLQSYWWEGYNPGPGELITSDDTLRMPYIRPRSAAEIIYNAAQEAKINPKFLLVTLQKEQGLIEKTSFDQRALDYATGYYCFDGQACNPLWQGFGKQVRAAALQFRDYVDNIHLRPYQPGQPAVIDGQTVVPANRITAAMYVYTPHLHGNLLFFNIWQRYGFGLYNVVKGIIPEGALVKAKSGEDTKSVYLIHNNKKWLFENQNALVSRYDPKKVLSVDPKEIEKFVTGPTIKYANYSVLQGPDGQRYLLDGLKKRLIASAEIFRNLGFSADEIIEVPSLDLAMLSDGPSLTKENPTPYGKLLRDTKTKSIYYIKDGNKHLVIEKMIININFPTLKIVDATTKTIDKYISQLPLLLNDGVLVKVANDPRVYVIAGGQRLRIADENTFIGLGYSWGDIKTVSQRILELHDIGQTINL